MRDETRTPFAIARTAWIGPACGLVCSMIMILIGRRLDYQYRHEASMSVYFLVMILVSGYYNGKLGTQPAGVVGLAILGAAGAVAMVRWFQ